MSSSDAAPSLKGQGLPSEEEMARFFRMIDPRDPSAWAAIAFAAADRFEHAVESHALLDPLGVARAQAKVLRAVAAQDAAALLDAMVFHRDPVPSEPSRHHVPLASTTIRTPYADVHLSPFGEDMVGVVMEGIGVPAPSLIDGVYGTPAMAQDAVRTVMRGLLDAARAARGVQADGAHEGAADVATTTPDATDGAATDPTFHQVIYTTRSYAEAVIGVFDNEQAAHDALALASDDVQRNSRVEPIVANRLHPLV